MEAGRVNHGLPLQEWASVSCGLTHSPFLLLLFHARGRAPFTSCLKQTTVSNQLKEFWFTLNHSKGTFSPNCNLALSWLSMGGQDSMAATHCSSGMPDCLYVDTTLLIDWAGEPHWCISSSTPSLCYLPKAGSTASPTLPTHFGCYQSSVICNAIHMFGLFSSLFCSYSQMSYLDILMDVAICFECYPGYLDNWTCEDCALKK